MSTILRLILDEEISSHDLVEWLVLKKTKNAQLKKLEKERADFIPYFLNYLRDQSNKLMQTSQTSGLTPVKKFTLYPKVNPNRVNNNRAKGSSRTELFPDNNTQKFVKKSRENEFKPIQTKPKPTSQKLCLGQFITNSTFNQPPKKYQSFKTICKTEKKEETVFDFKDLSSFPPVGSVNTIVAKKKAESFRKNENPESKADNTKCHTMETIPPSPDKVTCKHKLDILIDVYISLLNENCMPNLTVELYFLIQLLTVRIKSPAMSDISQNDEFATVHNCVYFACKVFTTQQTLLSLLDQGTLKLLADNSRLILFVPKLIPAILDKCDSTPCNTVISSYTIPSVSFQSDTDNRQNFSSDQAFHLFRKLRDQFYETLREWEANQANSEWSFSMYLGERVKRMMGMWMDPIIYSHFAKLFTSQLITACKGNFSQNATSLSLDFPSELLANLKSNPEKLNRLNKRFVTPARAGGPSPPPSFPGIQEFFRDFIVFSGCSMLNRHLVDVMVAKTYELLSTDFNLPEVGDSIDDNLRLQFTTCLLTLRLLGKFLGLITFLPYHTMEKIPKEMDEDYTTSRSKIPLVIDVVDLMKRTSNTGKLVLSIPCLVEFFSMMDKCAPLLHQVQQGLKMLIQVYKSPQFGRSSQSLNVFLILNVLGWLFETPNFPSSLFFVDIQEENFQIKDAPNISLDTLELVNHQILYTCCPYLGELKVMLAEFAAGTSSGTNTIKKIIPTVLNDRVSKSKSTKLLQLQLEENFFHNQPTSIKKIVDFVAERMASNVTKRVRKDHITAAENKMLKTLQEFMKENEDKDNYAMFLKEKIQQLAASVTEQVRNEISQHCHEYCKTQVDKIMQLLMSEDSSAAVIKTCGQIAVRHAHQNVNNWINTHVTLGFFLDELKTVAEKYNRLKNLPPNPKQHEIQSISSYELSPSEICIQLKQLTKQIYMARTTPNAEDIDTLLEKVKIVLVDVNDDWMTPLKKVYVQLSLELICGLIVLQPTTVSQRFNHLTNIWKSSQFTTDSLPPVISSCSLMFLTTAINHKESWQRMSELLVHLLKNNLITPQLLEGQCLDVLKCDWSNDTLNFLAVCLQDVISEYKKIDNSSYFTQLLEWLAWFCHQDENDFFDYE